MRKLATIQRINEIHVIPGADKIEVAHVLGWKVVIGKGEFQVGDLAVYFEIDSWLDASNPAFASFEERFVAWGSKRGMRLKTIKLRKQLSQGLLMPLGAFPELTASVRGLDHPQEGDDVTEILKIEKWEAPEEASNNGSNGGPSQASFPSFIFKTDQERVQNLGRDLARRDPAETFEVTIKLDGSSMTVYHLNSGSDHFDTMWKKRVARKPKTRWQKLTEWFSWLGWNKSPAFIQGVCSRNCELDAEGGSLFAQVARDGIFEALENMDANIALQGELIAPSIQQNYEKVEKAEFYVFDVFDIDNRCYFSPKNARELTELLGLTYVPMLHATLPLTHFADIDHSDKPVNVVDNILEWAEGPGMSQGVKREGVVFKSNDEPSFSFKAISNSYLLKKEGK